jgi:hypothetical protein
MRAGGLASRARKQDIMNFTELAVVGRPFERCLSYGPSQFASSGVVFR